MSGETAVVEAGAAPEISDDIPGSNAKEYANVVPPAVLAQHEQLIAESAEEEAESADVTVEDVVDETVEVAPEVGEAAPEDPGETAPDDIDYPSEVTRLTASLDVLRGKYDKEGLAYRTKAAERESELVILRGKVAEFDQAPEPAKPVSTDEINIEALGLTEEEQQFGVEMVSLVKKVVDQLLPSILANVPAPVMPVASEVEITHDQFLDELEALVPDWEVVKDSPKFKIWLNKLDDISSIIRREHLERAVEDRDSSAAARLLNAYKTTLVKPPLPKPPAIDAQVALNTTSSTKELAGSQERNSNTMTAEEYQRQITDLMKGYKGTPRQAAKLKALEKFFDEGRIT